MKRQRIASLAASVLFLLTACDDGTKPAPTQTAQADAKPDPSAAAEPDAQPDAQPEDPADDVGDASAAAADDADDADDDDFAGYDPRVAKAAQLAAKITADPQRADDLLAAADLDRDELDALMYEIANDPDLTTQYRMARGI